MVSYIKSWSGRSWRFITSHWLLCLLVFSLAVRLIAISSERYWYDEAFTALIAGLSPLRALQAVAGDVHPPLWYIISWLTAHALGTSEIALRMPAAIFGSLSCLVLYKVLVPVGKREAMIGSGLLAVLPAQLAYSQEARMYSLLCFLVLLAIHSIQRGKWLRVMICLVLLMYTHNLSALYVAPLGVWSLVKGRKKALRYLPVVAAYLPWLVVAVRQLRSVAASFWIADPGSVGAALHYMLFTTFYNRLPAWAQWHGALAGISLTICSLWILRRDLKQLWHLVMIGVLPSAEMYSISLAWKPIMLDRALLPSGACLAALWALAWARSKRLGRYAMASIGVPMLALSFVSLFANVGSQKADYTDVVESVLAEWQDGDCIYNNSLSSVILFDRLLPPELPNYILPNIGDLSQSLSEETKLAMGIKQREIDADRLAGLGYRRMWLMYIDTPVTSDYERDAVLQVWHHYREIDVWWLAREEFGEFAVVQLDLTHRVD
jgi:hypothetical protein